MRYGIVPYVTWRFLLQIGCFMETAGIEPALCVPRQRGSFHVLRELRIVKGEMA